MGRPTPEAVMSKLIRKYFKFDLRKKTFQSASKFLPQLQTAWEKNGMDSKESKAVQEKIDAAVLKDEKDYVQLKKSVKKYPIMMNKILAKPKNKHQKKADGNPSFYRKDPFKSNETDPLYGYRL
jgi:hypothetical protein